MSADLADKISDAVENCLAFAMGKKGQFTRVSAYLKSLSDDPAWCADEVVEVQTRVIRALMRRIADVD
jgi:hypothetical protein